MLCREPSGASGFGKRPCLEWPGFAALIGSGKFEEDANVPLKRRAAGAFFRLRACSEESASPTRPGGNEESAFR